jgi:hypothetical protein
MFQLGMLRDMNPEACRCWQITKLQAITWLEYGALSKIVSVQ